MLGQDMFNAFIMLQFVLLFSINIVQFNVAITAFPRQNIIEADFNGISRELFTSMHNLQEFLIRE